MSSLGAESARPILCLLCAPPSIPAHVSSSSLPPSRGLERALEEAASSGVLDLSSRKLKEFPHTAANHDLSDTVEAGRGLPGTVDRSTSHGGLLQMLCQGLSWNRCLRQTPVLAEPSWLLQHTAAAHSQDRDQRPHRQDATVGPAGIPPLAHYCKQRAEQVSQLMVPFCIISNKKIGLMFSFQG